MYQGFNKTALSSQQSIAKSFIILLKEKEYSKISISEICSRASVSRQTFYSLFESKENIIAFELKKKYSFDPASECKCCGVPTLEQLSEGYAEYIIEKGDFIKLLVDNRITYLMHESLYECLAESAFTDSPVTADFIAGGLTTIAKHFCTDYCGIDRSHLKGIIYRLFSGAYFQ